MFHFGILDKNWIDTGLVLCMGLMAQDKDTDLEDLGSMYAVHDTFS